MDAPKVVPVGSDMLGLEATQNALVRTVTYKERDEKGQPVACSILDPWTPDLDAALNGCEYALKHNPKIESIELHRLNNQSLGTFVRAGKDGKQIVRRLAEAEDATMYRKEMNIAVEAHLAEINDIIEKKADEIRKIRDYINKCLAIMQFGLRVNLISQDQFDVNYSKLAEAKATADSYVQGGNVLK